jgi:hypothetical protein
MEYAGMMGLGAMSNIPSVSKIDSAIHKLIRGIYRHTDIQTAR